MLNFMAYKDLSVVEFSLKNPDHLLLNINNDKGKKKTSRGKFGRREVGKARRMVDQGMVDQAS